MPRVGPNYTLPEPPFVPQTSISSAAMNSDLSDIADALTGSLARNGAGGMTASLPLANDGFIFQNDPDTGISRSAANTMSVKCGGSEIASMSATGISVTGVVSATGDVSATGSVKQNGFALLPIGVIFPYAGPSAPSGYLLCYGQALSRTTYSALFAVLGTVYGAGDGSTTFNIPDLRGRVAAGGDGMGGVSAGRLTDAVSGIDSPGDGGGAQSRTLVTSNLPPYTPSGTISQANVQYTQRTDFQTGGSVFGVQTIVASGGSASVNLNPQTLTMNAQGGTSTPVVTVQPTLVTNYIIFAGV